MPPSPSTPSELPILGDARPTAPSEARQSRSSSSSRTATVVACCVGVALLILAAVAVLGGGAASPSSSTAALSSTAAASDVGSASGFSASSSAAAADAASGNEGTAWRLPRRTDGRKRSKIAPRSRTGNEKSPPTDDDDLVAVVDALRSRIFSEQPPTEDAFRHGSAGRAGRVEAARERAVAEELEYRRRRRRRRLPPRPSPLARSLFPPETLSTSDPRYVAACVVLKDQNADLPEFVAWHAALGIKTFYLYDHGSALPVEAREASELVSPSSGVDVRVQRLTDDMISSHPSKAPQMAAYDACVSSHRAKHEWLAFFDVDEMLVVASSSSSSPSPSPSSSSPSAATAADDDRLQVPSFPALLSRFHGAASGLALHWAMFGSSGRTSRKPDSLLTAEAFTACLPFSNGNNRHVKAVASTRMLDVAEPCMGPHHFSYWDFEGAVSAAAEREGESTRNSSSSSTSPPTSTPSSLSRRPRPFAVDVEGYRIDGPVSLSAPAPAGRQRRDLIPHSPAFLAHYLVKSREEYEAKMHRGNVMTGAKENGRGWKFFDETDELSTETCTEASELAKKIRLAGLIRGFT